MPTLVDETNREVRIPDEPRRIISLSPSITEILFNIGFGDRIIGVTPYCVRPEDAKKKKKVGSYGYVNIDLFKSLNPDLILTVTGYQEKVAEQLGNLFPTFSFRLPATLAGVLDLVVKVSLVIGQPDSGRRLEDELFSIIKNTKRGNGGRVYIECDLGGPVTFGALSYITDVLNFFNFKSIYSREMKEWIVPDFKFVEQEDPDVIIFEPKMFSKRDSSILERIAKQRGWDKLSAFKRGNVFVTPGEYDFFAHHGPSLIREVIPWLSMISTKT
ncbi:MAG: ABC transporter substrate-binding protein [Thermoplasmatales archaeon]